jgi:hypothetical protein
MAKFGLSDGNDYGLDSYEIARSILQEFHFVGIVDEMKKSLEMLTDLLAQHGIKAYFGSAGRQNSCPERARPTWLTLGDEVGRRVVEASKSDLLLYRQFRETLLASHAKLRKRCWLGLRPAMADAKDAFCSQSWHGVARSLADSGQLFWKRRGLVDSPPRARGLDLSSDVLEERAAQAFAERAKIAVAAGPDWQQR